MTQPVYDVYAKRLKNGVIEPDPAQLNAVRRLDDLAARLTGYRPKRARRRGLFGRALPEKPRGLYLHGGVGRGKTMLMDLFFDAATFKPKARMHFHEFMAMVHDRIGEARHAVKGDPIPEVARRISEDAGLLCFDELHVTDIADAMILGRLFKVLFENGLIVVATSNAYPTELYKDGLNRQLFLPFVDLISTNMDVMELEAAKDFRLDKLAGHPLYFTPADSSARSQLDDHWQRLICNQPAKPAVLEVKGRAVEVPLAAMGVARFSFDDLCSRPLGALDYLHIAHAFHTVLIDNIPVMGAEKRNEARRFINLIDAFYDQGVCLIVSADAEPDQLYEKGDGADLFARTASRLIEMRSEAYLMARHQDILKGPADQPRAPEAIT